MATVKIEGTKLVLVDDNGDESNYQVSLIRTTPSFTYKIIGDTALVINGYLVDIAEVIGNEVYLHFKAIELQDINIFSPVVYKQQFYIQVKTDPGYLIPCIKTGVNGSIIYDIHPESNFQLGITYDQTDQYDENIGHSWIYINSRDELIRSKRQLVIGFQFEANVTKMYLASLVADKH